MKDLRITLVQSSLVWENKAANLKQFESVLASLHDSTHVVVLPEMFTTGFTMNAPELAESLQGQTMDWLIRMSAKYRCTTVHALSSRHGTRVTMDDASVLTFHGTGSGLAVLAFLPEPEIKAILSAPLKPHTQETVTDPKRIREQIAEVRRSGIAESVGGFEKDVHSHAAPIFDAEERVMGAIAIAAPVTRMTPELRSEIRAALAKGAQELINRLGGHVPAHLRPAA